MPLEVYDAMTRAPACVRIYVNAEPSDNPMQSELSGHIGGSGNLFCHRCDVGGPDDMKQSDEGFHALFSVRGCVVAFPCWSSLNPVQPANLCSKEAVLAELEEQIKLACTGVEKHVKTRQTATGVKDAFTQRWIDDLIKRARAARATDPTRTAEEVRDELMTWVQANHEQLFNPCLTTRGKYPQTHVCPPPD